MQGRKEITKAARGMRGRERRVGIKRGLKISRVNSLWAPGPINMYKGQFLAARRGGGLRGRT